MTQKYQLQIDFNVPNADLANYIVERIIEEANKITGAIGNHQLLITVLK